MRNEVLASYLVQHPRRGLILAKGASASTLVLLLYFIPIFLPLTTFIGFVRVESSDVSILIGIFLLATIKRKSRIQPAFAPLLISLVSVFVLSDFIYTAHMKNSINAQIDITRILVHYLIIHGLFLRLEKPLRSTFRVMLLVFIFLAAVALLQGVTGKPYGVMKELFGLEGNFTQARVSSGTVIRVSGTHWHPIGFGLWVVAITPIVLFGIRRFARSRAAEFLVVTTAFIMLYMSLTRGTILTFSAFLLIAYLYYGSSRSISQLVIKYTIFLFVALSIATFGFHAQTIDSRLLERFSVFSQDERLIHYRMALDLVSIDPLLLFYGTGSNAFTPAAITYDAYLGQPYNYYRDLDTTVGIHNIYIKFLSENGVFALLVTFLIMGRFWLLVTKNGNETSCIDSSMYMIRAGGVSIAILFLFYLLPAGAYFGPIIGLYLVIASFFVRGLAVNHDSTSCRSKCLVCSR